MVYIGTLGAEEHVQALCLSVKGDYVEFPRDATYLATGDNRLNIKVSIPGKYMPKTSAKRAIYYLTFPDKRIMLEKDQIFSFHRDKIYPDEMEEFRKSQTIDLKCAAGEYAVYSIREVGGRLQRIGTVTVAESDDGRTLGFTLDE